MFKQVKQNLRNAVAPPTEKRFSVSVVAFLIVVASVALAIVTKWQVGLGFLVFMILMSIPIGKKFNF